MQTKKRIDTFRVDSEIRTLSAGLLLDYIRESLRIMRKKYGNLSGSLFLKNGKTIVFREGEPNKDMPQLSFNEIKAMEWYALKSLRPHKKARRNKKV